MLAALGGALGVGLAIADRPGADRLSALRPHAALALQHAGLDRARLHLRHLAAGRRSLRLDSGARNPRGPDLANTLKDQAGAVIHGGSARLRKGLVVAQVSLSLVLLIGAELFLQSLNNLKTLNPGFDVKNLLAFDVDPTMSRYDTKWTRGLLPPPARRA